MRVLRQLPALEEKGISVDLRNTMTHRHHAQDLMQKGGSRMVPCLLIENEGEQQWMYESMDILKYLQAL
jgi:glutathione S-transferase